MVRDLSVAAARQLLDLIAPSRCMGCAEEGTWLCHTCASLTIGFTQHCVVCHKESRRGITCSDCRDETPFTGVLSAGPYINPALRRGIGWLKFKGIRPVAEPLAGLLIPYLSLIAPLSTLINQAVLVPVPLHVRRSRQRGFNQSEEIARAITTFTSIPTEDFLRRTKATWAQAKLPMELRQKNSENAFAVLTPPLKKYYILLDDVVTSGSTLSAVAKTLQTPILPNAQIWAMTVARG